MPLEQSEAIILKTSNTGEQDKIVVFLTRDEGLMRGVAKGARKFGNRFGSSLEPMSLVNIFYYEKERKDWVTIGNCDLIESFFDLQKSLKVSFTLSYFAELIEEFCPARAKDDLIFRLLLSILQAIRGQGDLNFLTRYFEGWFLKINGLLPDFRKCKKCRRPFSDSSWLSPRRDGIFCGRCAPDKKEEVKSELGEFLKWIGKNPPPSEKSVPFASEELESIKKNLQSIIIYHLEKEPKTLHYLNEA